MGGEPGVIHGQFGHAALHAEVVHLQLLATHADGHDVAGQQGAGKRDVSPVLHRTNAMPGIETTLHTTVRHDLTSFDRRRLIVQNCARD